MDNKFLSYNVGSNSSLAGVNQLISLFDPLFIFLQEVTISTEQLLAQVSSDYSGMCNTDIDSTKPGNAVLWKKDIAVVVVNIVVLRLQLVKSDVYGNFVNIYAPTGNQGERGRRNLFTQDLSTLIQNTFPRPFLIGDWNCLTRKEDVENWQTLTTDALSKKLSIHLKQLVKDCRYTDCFLVQNSTRI